MPLNITAETPRRPRSIGAKDVGNVIVQVAAPYAAGHVITEAEASMLNQTIAENVSNNLRDKIVKFVPAGEYSEQNPAPEARLATTDEAQSLVDEYLSKYEPGVRQGGGGGGSRALTPVEKEMREIATEKLKALLKSQGLKQNEVPFAELRDQIIADHADDLRAAAEKIVRAREKNDVGIDLGGLTLPGQASGGGSTEG